MRAHSYSHMCGCHACCLHEARMERDDALREEYRWALLECPAYLSELSLDGADSANAAKAIAANDLAELGRIYRDAALASADWYIADRADRLGINPGEAARQLFDIYRPDEGRQAA